MMSSDGDDAIRYAEAAYRPTVETLAKQVVTTAFRMVAAGYGWGVEPTADEADLIVWRGGTPVRVLIIGLTVSEMKRWRADSRVRLTSMLRGALRRALVDADSLRSRGHRILIIAPAVRELGNGIDRIKCSPAYSEYTILLIGLDGTPVGVREWPPAWPIEHSSVRGARNG